MAAPPWVLVFDGDCGFCRYTADYARAVTDGEGGGVSYEPFQTAAVNYPAVPVEEFQNSIQLFTPNTRYQGAEAAFRVLARAPRLSGWLWCYRRVVLFAVLVEVLYRFTARNRSAIYRLARPLFGARLLPADYRLTSNLITRGVGLAALCAFASWWWQAAGLIGEGGILPVADYFAAARAQLGPRGWLLLPSLYWISSAGWMTTLLCAAGTLASAMLLLRILPVAAALVAYVCYLSLEYGGQVFLEYQWDILLIESLILAAVLGSQPRIGIWLTRLLVFRFMLLSGAVKLISGDPTWRSLSALDVHFETQPLPTALAWYAHQLPRGVLHAGVVATFVIELGLPFFIFGPRNVRRFAAAGILLLQLLILLTGNYNFFNLLVIVLCLSLFDDRTFGVTFQPQKRSTTRRSASTPWRVVVALMALLGALQIHQTIGRASLAGWELAVLRAVEPLQLVNSYGLFAVMTTERDELVVEGSEDAFDWHELPFKFKPQQLADAPKWVTPYQPRLDWQMWFAALTSREGAPWFDNFVVRLLGGAPAVKALMAPSQFDKEPPNFVRVLRYRYQFTSSEQRQRTGQWWRREYIGVWYPPAKLAVRSLDGDALPPD